MKMSPGELLARLPLPADEKWKNGVPFLPAFVKNGFVMRFFAPHGIDCQTPHDKDEIYIIADSTAELIREDESVNCKTGDALFVATAAARRFEKISEDFAAWVITF